MAEQKRTYQLLPDVREETMKCDELKVYEQLEDYVSYNDAPIEMYDKSEVDEAIAELKDELENACLERNDNQTAIDEYVKENIALKRALWLARAERAVAEQTIDEWSRYKEKHPCGSWRDDSFEYWVQTWIYVEKLCRRKAEEYK